MADELKKLKACEGPLIVGWMVFGKDLADSAMYNLNQREEAFDAARRWGDSIVAVIQHPDTPKP